MALFSQGISTAHKGREIIQKDEIPVSESYTDATFHIYEKLFNLLTFSRILLLFISFKYSKVTKYMIYYQLLIVLVAEIGIPQDRGSSVSVSAFLQIYLTIIFILDYFDFF